MENIRNRNLIKILLTMLINAEKDMEKFCDNMRKNEFLVNIEIEEAKEILCFNDLIKALEVESIEQEEVIYELLGNMIEKDVDLNVAIENFLKFNRI